MLSFHSNTTAKQIRKTPTAASYGVVKTAGRCMRHQWGHHWIWCFPAIPKKEPLSHRCPVRQPLSTAVILCPAPNKASPTRGKSESGKFKQTSDWPTKGIQRVGAARTRLIMLSLYAMTYYSRTWSGTTNFSIWSVGRSMIVVVTLRYIRHNLLHLIRNNFKWAAAGAVLNMMRE